MYDHPVYTTDFSCPIHKLAKDVMLRSRHYESGSRQICIAMLTEDAKKLKEMIQDFDYEYLKDRKDLLFFLKNATSRIQYSPNTEFKDHLRICLNLVECAVRLGRK